MEFLSFLPNIVICMGGIAVTVYAVIEKSGGTYFLKRIVSWPKCLEFFGGIAVTVCSLILAVQQNRFEHQIVSMITGGESYCYMQFLNYQDANDTVDLLFKCDGDYPVYDVGVRIDNVQKIAAAVEQIIKLQPPSLMDAAEIAGKDSYLKSLGNVARKSAFIFGKLELPKTDEQDFNVSVLARNGGIFQRVRFRRVEGIWTKAERIERNQAVIREEIDSKYPKNAEGKVDWKN